MSVLWYYNQQGQNFGPVSAEQLRQLMECGQLQPSDFVWKEGMAQWVAAANIFRIPRPADNGIRSSSNDN